MSHEVQKRRVAGVAAALTCLLAGLFIGGAVIQKRWSGKLSDAEFLKGRLESLSPDSSQSGPKQAPAALVRVDYASEETVQPEKPVVGRLTEVRRASISSEVPGTIVSMDVEEGSPVTGGKTVLAKIDDIWTRLAIDKQKARIEAIQAQLTIAEANVNWLARTLELKAASTKEYNDQAALAEQRRAELKEAQAQLADLEEQLRRVVIVAPFDGWVMHKYAELGQRVSVGAPVVDIVSRGTIYAEVNVPESMINGLKLGMSAAVRIDPLGRVVTGKLASINPYGATASRPFPVRIALDDVQGELKVGMSATAILPVGLRSRQIMVAQDAVLTRPDGSTVWMVVGDGDNQLRARPVPVDVVASVGDRQAVRPASRVGLPDKARVVIEGAERLYPNQAVRIVQETAARVDEVTDGASAPESR